MIPKLWRVDRLHGLAGISDNVSAVGRVARCRSSGEPVVIATALPPRIGSFQMSPGRSKTMCLPSGATSTDVHLPSRVSNRSSRVAQTRASEAHRQGVATLMTGDRSSHQLARCERVRRDAAEQPFVTGSTALEVPQATQYAREGENASVSCGYQLVSRPVPIWIRTGNTAADHAAPQPLNDPGDSGPEQFT